MAKPREDVIEGEVVALAEKDGWLVRKLQYPGRRGAPDRMFVKFWYDYNRARIVFIEFKRPGGKVRGIQRKEHQKLRERGAEVHVVDSVEKAKEILGIE